MMQHLKCDNQWPCRRSDNEVQQIWDVSILLDKPSTIKRKENDSLAEAGDGTPVVKMSQLSKNKPDT
jgi:hypothetical protein